MGRTALITGITGQDGAYLAKLLLAKGYSVVGSVRPMSGVGTWRLQELEVLGDVEIVSMDLTDDLHVREILEKVRPDEVYNLAGRSFVEDSFRQPIQTAQVGAIGALRLLEHIRTSLPEARFYQASTSEMFGKARQVPQSESTPFYPRSPYGTAKVFAHWTVVNYRETFGVHCCSGILFNHESPLRGVEFLTRKVSLGMARYALRRDGPIHLGNLDARRDWGHARDYVSAIWKMMQLPSPADFVVATGTTNTVRGFVDMAARAAGITLDWVGEGRDEKGIDRANGATVVTVDPMFYRPTELDLLVGDASKARQALGWHPSVGLEQLAGEMVATDLRRVSSNSVAGGR